MIWQIREMFRLQKVFRGRCKLAGGPMDFKYNPNADNSGTQLPAPLHICHIVLEEIKTFKVK